MGEDFPIAGGCAGRAGLPSHPGSDRRAGSRWVAAGIRAQTLANGFWNSISLAARTSSATPRSRSIVVSNPFLRIFS